MNALESVEKRFETLDIENVIENTPEYIILHSNRTYKEFEDLVECHKNKNGWSGVGYHLFLAESGLVSQGRPFDKEGAHTLGFNFNSIGFCIYSPDGGIADEKVDKGREVIDGIREIYGNLPVISHTYAQVIYNNRLLEKYGIEERFPVSLDVAKHEKYEELRKDMMRIAGTLSSGSHYEVKKQLKSFKNCPEEMYFKFI